MVSYAKTPNALLNNAGRLASRDDGIVGNLAAGTQYGFSPHLATLDAATPLCLRPITYVVTHVPGMFRLIPGMTEFCKIFFEQHCHQVDGIQVQYTNQGSEAPAMADGQRYKVATDTHRSEMSPSFNCHEINGNGCWFFIKEWMIMIKNPETQAAALEGTKATNDASLPPHTFSVWSADLAGIVYDTTLRASNVIDGFQLTALWPNDTGDAQYQREISNSVVPERSFQFSCVWQQNRNTSAVAVLLAQALALHKVNTDFATPVSRDIESLIQNMGIQKEVAQDASRYTPLGASAAQV